MTKTLHALPRGQARVEVEIKNQDFHLFTSRGHSNPVYIGSFEYAADARFHAACRAQRYSSPTAYYLVVSDYPATPPQIVFDSRVDKFEPLTFKIDPITD